MGQSNKVIAQVGKRELDSIKKTFKKSNMFDELTDAELEEVAKLSQRRVYRVGDIVFTEGETAKELYIIEDGTVVLEMSIRLGRSSGRQGSIDVLSKGQVFGWSAIAEPNIFTMSARCLEKTTVIAIDRARLQLLFDENSSLGFKLMKKIVGVVSSRLARSRDTLAHIMSIAFHDLKSPLAAVQSYLQVILDGYTGDISEKQKGMLIRSSERIKELLNLINNILDISRIDTGQLQMEKVSFLEIIDSSVETARRVAKEKGLKITAEVPKELSPIDAAPNRIQQLMNNLLGNAIKFTPEGGTINLKVTEGRQNILVEIQDTGIGIKAADLPRIFDDFYRGADVDTPGAGLGLSIAKKIVRAHYGKIWVESPSPETGVGSKFSFTLPKTSLYLKIEPPSDVKKEGV
jgi:signal transduction histidine kinase